MLLILEQNRKFRNLSWSSSASSEAFGRNDGVLSVVIVYSCTM